MRNRCKLRTIFVVILAFAIVAPAVLADAVATDTISLDITVNPVAAIKVSGTALQFSVDAPVAAGDLPVITETANDPTYIQYTSVVPSAQTRTIAVQSDTAMPAGLKLNVRAGTPTGHGGLGTPVAGGIMIDSTYTAATDQTLLTGITSCATGTGATQGAGIYYTLAIDEATFANLTTDGAAGIVITYTLVGP